MLCAPPKAPKRARAGGANSGVRRPPLAPPTGPSARRATLGSSSSGYATNVVWHTCARAMPRRTAQLHNGRNASYRAHVGRAAHAQTGLDTRRIGFDNMANVCYTDDDSFIEDYRRIENMSVDGLGGRMNQSSRSRDVPRCCFDYRRRRVRLRDF